MSTCKYCGEEIQSYDKRRVYCSRACRNKDNPTRGKKLATIPKVCEICGKKYLARRSDRRYCSPSCMWRARQLRAPRQSMPDQTYWRKHRHEVLDRQEGKCWLCQEPIDPSESFEVHHLQGDKDLRNDDVVALHRGCHKYFHGISLLIKDGEIIFESPIIERVRERLLEYREIK